MKPDDLKRLLDAATAGPWAYDRENYIFQAHDESNMICEMRGAGTRRVEIDANGALLVALRNLAPLLYELWAAEKASSDAITLWNEIMEENGDETWNTRQGAALDACSSSMTRITKAIEALEAYKDQK